MVDLKKAPFFLTDAQIAWVEATQKAMTDDQKIEQLFCPLISTTDPKALREMASNHSYGGIMFRNGDANELQSAINAAQEAAEIPFLVSANLESGGDGIADNGTYMGRQMLIAATNDEQQAWRLGRLCGLEGAAVGVNWAFSPVLDIDNNYHNPITNVRTYGSDPIRVTRMGRAYMEGMKNTGVTPTPKHFPGDGQDERDQHLVTSVNPMTLDQWEASYGRVYRAMIAQGALTMMVGHIAMPAMEEAFDGSVCNRAIPASCSKNIMTRYLRGEMGFNGLISTDATPMIGFCSSSSRRDLVPGCIESGADVILFNRDMDEDLMYMKAGVADGRLSRERLEDAVTRILATKAALHLPEKKANGSIYKTADDLSVLACPEHLQWAKECADAGVTLVKDTQNLLPLSAEKTPRVLLQLLGDYPSNGRVKEEVEQLMKAEGFQITWYQPETLETIFNTESAEEFRAKYDLVLYIGNIETASNKTVARINWHTLFGLGNNMPWFVHEVPTLFVSLGNPYHLLDVPMIKTYINGYCNAPTVIHAIVDKLMGRSSFKGKSPVDPFCGKWDTRL